MGRKNFLKQRRSLAGLKNRSGGKLERKCGVRGWVLRRGSYKASRRSFKQGGFSFLAKGVSRRGASRRGFEEGAS